MFIARRALIFDESIYGRKRCFAPTELGSSFAFGSIDISPLRGFAQMRCWNYSTHMGESEKYPTVWSIVWRPVKKLSRVEQLA